MPSLNILAFDQFGSHVLQSLLHSLHAKLREDSLINRKQSLRSNKSRNWKAKQVPMVSLFQPSESSTQKAPLLTPPSFNEVTATILHSLKGQLSGAEVRLLAGKPMSSPLLQVRIVYPIIYPRPIFTDLVFDTYRVRSWGSKRTRLTS